VSGKSFSALQRRIMLYRDLIKLKHNLFDAALEAFQQIPFLCSADWNSAQ